MEIRDQVFIVTGGASGLGAGTARTLAEAGGKVVIADLNEAAGNALAQELVAKDPIALQFTKESLQHVESMTWDAALNYNAAKFAELKTRQQGAGSRAASVANFLAGKSRPGLGQ